MWHSFAELFRVAVGLSEPGAMNITAAQMAARSAVGFVVLLILIRLGRRRLMGRIGPFDLVVTMILGSTLSRGMTANAPMLPVLAACATIIAMHWLISALAAHSQRLSRWIQGEAIDLSTVKQAVLERSGNISIVKDDGRKH